MGKDKMTASDVVNSLRLRYSDKQRYGFLEQVCDGTGMYANSWVDAVVVYLWPSDGIRRIAFEVKVSRADFMGEIQKPLKNKWFKEAFQEFYYVTPPGKVVVHSEDEIPHGCGWMIATTNGTRIKKAAQVKEGFSEDAELTIASFVRSSVKAGMESGQKDEVEFLATSKKHQRALNHENAVIKFMHEKGDDFYNYATEESILKDLIKASCSDDVQQKLKQIAKRIDDFDEAIEGMLLEAVRLGVGGLGVTGGLIKDLDKYSGLSVKELNYSHKSKVTEWLKKLLTDVEKESHE